MGIVVLDKWHVLSLFASLLGEPSLFDFWAIFESNLLPQVIEVTQKMIGKRQKNDQDTIDRGWEEEYFAYLKEKEAKTAADECLNEKETGGSGKAMQDDSAEDWAVQYQEYCIEKEKAHDEAERKKKLQKEKE